MTLDLQKKSISIKNIFTQKLYINNPIVFNYLFYNINVILQTNSSNIYNINLKQSTNTFIINNIFNCIYKKKISKIENNNNITTFYSSNHNLKINDIIYFENLNNLFISKFNNIFILFKIINITNNTFQAISNNYYDNSFNNITNIIKTSTILNNSYFQLISNKTFKQIQRVEQFNRVFSTNHQLKLNTIIQLININSNILFTDFIDNSNLFIITSIINNDIFQITHFINNQISYNSNANRIFFESSNLQYSFLKINTITYLNNNIHFILPSINTNYIGYYYYIYINDSNLNNITIQTSNSDKLIGFTKLSSINTYSSDFIITSNDNSSTLSINNLDLKQSSFKITYISHNTWYINSFIYNNNFYYKLTYNSNNNSILFNNNIITNHIPLYINFIYHFDISDPTLINNSIHIINNNNINFFKYIIYFGKPGIPNSKIIFYVNNTFSINTIFNIKYINTNTSLQYTSLFGSIKQFQSIFT